MLRAFSTGLAVDQRSWNAGYEAGASGKRTACPEGMDVFSFFLGRAAALLRDNGSRVTDTR
jgi:hypothetical protein